MGKKDYYAVLGLKKGASVAEVKGAYKRLAKKYHPDISKEQDAEAKFKEVLEAYQTLSDAQKKANYDRFGHAAQGFQGFQGFRGFNARDFEFDLGDLFNGFGGMFGGNVGNAFRDAFGQKNRRGSNIRHDINIKFEEAAFGTEKEITIERDDSCPKCSGAGGEGKKTCQICQGRGVIRQERRTPFGVFATQSNCHDCGGEGHTVENVCKKCDGKGITKVKKKITVKIPGGIASGNHLRLQGRGNAGRKGGHAGDLFIVVFVEPHKIFKRDGIDIYAEIPISFSEASLGTKLDVPTMKGKATIKVPAGTQSGTIFRLKDKGIKELGGSGRGDEYIKTIVQVPKKMNKKQRELIEALAEEDGLKKERKSFFQKLGERFNKT
ncbi:MAG: molecular chaperone DnaJ [archaeon]|nr:molecular chaperone DnaJ [archaeon]